MIQHRVKDCHQSRVQLDYYDHEYDRGNKDDEYDEDHATFLIFNLCIFAQDDHAKVDVEGGGGTHKGARKELS